MKIKILDLFSGAGGFTQGFHKASECFETIAAVEIDKHAAASFRETFPNAEVYNDDIAHWVNVHASAYKNSVDVIIGGPPCQGFSLLGKRTPLDSRNNLWESYVAALKIIQPKYFVMENVPYFFKTPEYEKFISLMTRDAVLKDYIIESKVLLSSEYGSPQNRKRAIVLGTKKGNALLELPRKTHGKYSSGELLEFNTVYKSIGQVPARPDMDEVYEESKVSLEGSKTKGPFNLRQMHWSRNYTNLSIKRFESIPYGGNRFDIPEVYLANCWKKHKKGSTDVMGRLLWENPSVTIRTEFYKPEKGRYIHPIENRAITHYEAALLQGFPENHKFYGSKTSIAKQIGNAVPIELGMAIGLSIISSWSKDGN